MKIVHQMDSSAVGCRAELVAGGDLLTVEDVQPCDPPHAPRVLLRREDGSKVWESSTKIVKLHEPEPGVAVPIVNGPPDPDPHNQQERAIREEFSADDAET